MFTWFKRKKPSRMVDQRMVDQLWHYQEYKEFKQAEFNLAYNAALGELHSVFKDYLPIDVRVIQALPATHPFATDLLEINKRWRGLMFHYERES